jgi:DNA-binding response OmpR family regulator
MSMWRQLFETHDFCPTALIVDAEAGYRERLAERLRAVGYRVIEAGDVESCLAGLAGEIDIAVVAQDLPGVDGMDLCRAIRHRAGPPVLLLTDRLSSEGRAGLLEEGADGCMGRPADIEPLVARIGALVRSTAPWVRGRGRAPT